MARVYLIGGAPRSGKSTVVEKLIKAHPMLAAPTDAIRAVAKGMIKPEDNPKLFKLGRGDFDSKQNVSNFINNSNKVLDYELGESEETWKSVLDFISYTQRDGKDLAIEGVAVLPHNVTNLSFDNRVIFLINLEDQTDSMLRSAKIYEHEWLAKYSKETIKAFCVFNQKLNYYYYQQSKKYSQPYVIVRNQHFDEDTNSAVQKLLAD